MPACLLFLLLLSACGPALPKLPDIDFSRTQPAVREAVERAYGEAELASGDATKAAAVGQTLHGHGLLDQAVIFYQHARKLDPRNFAYAHLLGAALAERGTYADALESLNAALALKGDARSTKFILASALLASGGTVQAGETYRALGDNPAAHLGLGRTLQGQAAIDEYLKALAQEPRYGAAWKALADAYRTLGQTEQADEAERAYARHRLVQPLIEDPELAFVRELNVSTAGLLSRAREAMARARLNDAARLYEQVTVSEPDNEEAWASLIGVNVRLKDFAGAERAYENARQRKGESNANAVYQYGLVLAGTKRPTEAKAMFEKAIALDPNHADALFEVGVLHEAGGAPDQALECYGRTLYLDPANRMARFYAGRILASQRRPDAALTQLQRALASPVDDVTPLVRQQLAGAYEQMKQPERAVEQLRQARQVAVARSLQTVITSIDRDLVRLGAKP